MDIQTIADLAKQGGRLNSDKQWVLADALAELSDTQLSQVAAASGRNESTLAQYARAAERWDKTDRVEGVSFSAHRVVLSWHEPRELLIELKAQHGSPTVKQVRQAMGLEGHPAIEALIKGVKKLDRKINPDTLEEIVSYLNKHIQALKTGWVEDTEAVEAIDTDEIEAQEVDNTEVTETEPTPNKGTWQPPIRTDDIAGI